MKKRLPGFFSRLVLVFLIGLGLIFPSASLASERRTVYAFGQRYVPGSSSLPEALKEMHMVRGDSLLLKNLDFAAHDVTSMAVDRFGIPIFQSDAVTGPNRVVEVKRAPALKSGTYRFFCTTHPFMVGVLVVE